MYIILTATKCTFLAMNGAAGKVWLKMHRIHNVIQEHDFPLPSEWRPDDYKGHELFAGTQSVGKSPSFARACGKQLEPSGAHTSTCSPTSYILIHSDKERLDCVLPAVKKKGKEIFPREAHEDLLKKCPLQALRDH